MSHINDASKSNLKKCLQCPPHSFSTCKNRTLNKEGNFCKHVFPLSTFRAIWGEGRWGVVFGDGFWRHLKLENPHISQGIDRSKISAPVWGYALHSTARPCHQLTAKARVFLKTAQTWRCDSSAHFSNGSKNALLTLLFHSFYVPQYLDHKTATCQW